MTIRYRMDGAIAAAFACCERHGHATARIPEGRSTRDRLLEALMPQVESFVGNLVDHALAKDASGAASDPALVLAHVEVTRDEPKLAPRLRGEWERHMIERCEKTLRDCNGSAARAAEVLGISRFTLYRWIRRRKEPQYGRTGGKLALSG